MTGLGVRHLPQPVPRRAACTHTNDNKTGQATEYLATGKGHERNYLWICDGPVGPQKANTIHPQMRNSKETKMKKTCGENFPTEE
jgi:hypothetical protein